MTDQLSSTTGITDTGSGAPALNAPGWDQRLRSVWPWLALGVATTIAGGLLAAIVAHDPTEKPVWATAYLVLVAGLGQVGLALGRALLAPRPPSFGAVSRDFVLFGLGNAGVVVGTLVDVLWLVDVGGAVLVLSLALMAWGVRTAVESSSHRSPTWVVAALWVYRVLVLVLLVSIPVGLVLAQQ